jgi:hypothetical protein
MHNSGQAGRERPPNPGPMRLTLISSGTPGACRARDASWAREFQLDLRMRCAEVEEQQERTAVVDACGRQPGRQCEKQLRGKTISHYRTQHPACRPRVCESAARRGHFGAISLSPKHYGGMLHRVGNRGHDDIIASTVRFVTRAWVLPPRVVLPPAPPHAQRPPRRACAGTANAELDALPGVQQMPTWQQGRSLVGSQEPW